MNIDIAALRMIEADKGISIETVITAIETALLTAYRHTDGFAPHARVDVNRKSGAVRVMAQEVDQDGNVVHEWDDTPEGFGRIAATTARQVILQRLRDAENEKNFGDLVAHEGEIVGGVVQQDSRANARGMVVVQIGSDANSTEGIIPPAEQVPGEVYTHGDRIKCYVVGVSRGPRGPQITLSRTHPNLVRKLFSLEVPEIADGQVQIAAIAREAGHRTKIAVLSNNPDVSAKGAKLRKLHLMDPAAIGPTPYPFTGDGDNVVDKPRFEDGRVWINATQYFDSAPEVSWGFFIGGYQPAQKWLKDRKGRALSFDDVKHYQRILKILAETDRIMGTISMTLDVPA